MQITSLGKINYVFQNKEMRKVTLFEFCNLFKILL